MYELIEKEKKDPSFRFAAAWGYPLGSKVIVTNVATGKSSIVEIADRGPAKSLGRIIDVSRQTACDLGFVREGVTKVRIEEIAS